MKQPLLFDVGEASELPRKEKPKEVFFPRSGHFQLPVAVDGLYSTEARLHGRNPDSITGPDRSWCIDGKDARRSGELQCKAIMCVHHLFGKAALEQGDESAVERAMISYLSGEINDCCVLDIVEDGIPVDDDQIALLLGVDRERVPQIGAEAALSFRESSKKPGLSKRKLSRAKPEDR